PSKIEANPMLGMHGIRFSLKNPEILKAELNAMKRVSEKGKSIGILTPQVISLEEVKRLKEIIKEMDFKNAKVGVMIETPASVQIIKEICEEGIDFISFGTNDLTQYTLAVDRGNEQVQELYDDFHPSVLSQIAYVIKICKENNVETSICGQAGSKKEMVKFLIEQGISSISVNADMASEIAEYVSELEKGTVVEIEKPEKVETEKSEKSEKPVEERNDEAEESVEEDSGEEDVLPPYTNTDSEEELPVIPGTEYLKEEIEKEESEEKIEESVEEMQIKEESSETPMEKIPEESQEKQEETLDIF
ncbi:MAG: putative PEP-binding protein, partial [Candidatus Pacearchaeota archaeon]|nr:putative PEP-binding protein [Candidatus Pacearchaeota archaeon]